MLVQLAAGGIAASGNSGIHWWQTPLLAGACALLGVLIAQLVVLRIARRNERNRSEPELLRQCAAFSVATGKLKREFARRPSTPNLAAIEDLEAAADALDIIGTDALQDAAREVIGVMPLLTEPGKFTKEDFELPQALVLRPHGLQGSLPSALRQARGRSPAPSPATVVILNGRGWQATRSSASMMSRTRSSPTSMPRRARSACTRR